MLSNNNLVTYIGADRRAILSVLGLPVNDTTPLDQLWEEFSQKATTITSAGAGLVELNGELSIDPTFIASGTQAGLMSIAQLAALQNALPAIVNNGGNNSSTLANTPFGFTATVTDGVATASLQLTSTDLIFNGDKLLTESELPQIATSTSLGLVLSSTNAGELAINPTTGVGTINGAILNTNYATTSAHGIVQIGNGLNVATGVVSVGAATSTVIGGVISSSGDLQLSVNSGGVGTINNLSSTLSGMQTNISTNATNIGTLQTDVSANTSAILTLQTDVSANSSAITTLQGQVSTNSGNITTLQGQVSTNSSNITTLQGQVSTNTSDIATNASNITTNLQTAKTYTDEQIANSLKSIIRFIGYVSTTEPAAPAQGDLWINASSMPTTFPVTGVQEYNGSAWQAANDYIPTMFDLWANAADGNGYYWFDDTWEVLNFSIDMSLYRKAADQDVIDATFVVKNGTDRLMTQVEGTKLASIQQTDWNAVSGWAQILNKPAGIVVDPNYVATDNNFTNALLSKLDGIEAAAQVNVQADWNAASGGAQILNKPVLDGITLINTSGTWSAPPSYQGKLLAVVSDTSQLPTTGPAGYAIIYTNSPTTARSAYFDGTTWDYSADMSGWRKGDYWYADSLGQYFNTQPGFIVYDGSQVQFNVSAANSVVFDSSNNVNLRAGTIIQAPDSTNTVRALVELAQFEGNYDQVEIGNQNLHLNLNTNTDPTYGNHVTVGTPAGEKVVAYMDDITGVPPGTYVPVSNTSNSVTATVLNNGDSISLNVGTLQFVISGTQVTINNSFVYDSTTSTLTLNGYKVLTEADAASASDVTTAWGV